MPLCYLTIPTTLVLQYKCPFLFPAMLPHSFPLFSGDAPAHCSSYMLQAFICSLTLAGSIIKLPPVLTKKPYSLSHIDHFHRIRICLLIFNCFMHSEFTLFHIDYTCRGTETASLSPCQATIATLL